MTLAVGDLTFPLAVGDLGTRLGVPVTPPPFVLSLSIHFYKE